MKRRFTKRRFHKRRIHKRRAFKRMSRKKFNNGYDKIKVQVTVPVVQTTGTTAQANFTWFGSNPSASSLGYNALTQFTNMAAVYRQYIVDWIKMEIVPSVQIHAFALQGTAGYQATSLEQLSMASDLTQSIAGVSQAVMALRPDYKLVSPIRKYKKFVRLRKLIKDEGLGWCECNSLGEYDRAVTNKSLVFANTNILFTGQNLAAGVNYGTVNLSYGITFRDRYL